MKNAVLLCLLVYAASAQISTAPNPGPSRLMNGSDTFANGVTVRFAAYAFPGGKKADAYAEGGMMDDATVVHRFMVDPVTQASVGYDIAITGDKVQGYTATFRALTKTMLEGSRIVVPKFPPPQPVKDGDTIFLELMASPDGTQHIVDYLQIVLPHPEPPVTQAEPRDFSLDDGPVTFDPSPMTVWVDGQRWTGPSGFSVSPGATFFMAVPNAGRYILSLTPHEGMVKAGAVRDHVLSFQDGGHAYEVHFASPIAGAGKAWNVYMIHDASYQQRGAFAGYFTGVGRYEDLAPKHRFL